MEDTIKRQDRRFVQDSKAIRAQRRALRTMRDKKNGGLAEELRTQMVGRQLIAFEEAGMRGGSSWLTAEPRKDMGLGLSRQEFRDKLALRFGREFPDPLVKRCPSCGAGFSVSHALKCKVGGFVWKRHREVLREWAAGFRQVLPFGSVLCP